LNIGSDFHLYEKAIGVLGGTRILNSDLLFRRSMQKVGHMPKMSSAMFSATNLYSKMAALLSKPARLEEDLSTEINFDQCP
jgi:hypothetical protein